MWPIGLSTRLPIAGTVGYYPAVYLMGRDPIPYRTRLSRLPHEEEKEYPVLAQVSLRYPEVGGRLVTCYSPVRHSIHVRRRLNRSTCMC